MADENATHLARSPFKALCGADKANQHTADNLGLVTCVGCLRLYAKQFELCEHDRLRARCKECPSARSIDRATASPEEVAAAIKHAIQTGTTLTILDNGTPRSQIVTPKAQRQTPEEREQSWITGNRAAWRNLLGVALGELRGLGAEDDLQIGLARAACEIESTRAALRLACEEFTDREQDMSRWPDTLHLADVVDKFLMSAVRTRLQELEGALEEIVELTTERSDADILEDIMIIVARVHPDALTESA